MKFIWFGFIFLWTLSISAQEVRVQLLKKIPLKTDRFVGEDKYGSLYVITDKTLYKETPEGERRQFSLLRLGQLTSVDITNPLKLVLFYKHTNTVVLLDDQLNSIRQIDFNTLSYFRTVSYAANAAQNSLWVFNTDNRELERFDYEREAVIAHSQPISGKILDLESNFNYCWLLTDQKLLAFNAYGSFMGAYPNKNLEKIGFYDNYLIGYGAHKLWLFDIKQTRYFKLLEEVVVKNIFIRGNRLMIYDGDWLFTYQIIREN